MAEPFSFLSMQFTGDGYDYGIRRFAPQQFILPPHDAILTEEELAKKEKNNIYRALLRSMKSFLGYAQVNTFSWWVTLSFDARQSEEGFPIADKFIRWMSDRFRRLGIHAAYLLVVVPNPSDNGQWHLHILLGDVPDDEFIDLRTFRVQMTEDAKVKIEHGATIYGWPAFRDRFQSLAFIEHFGDRDEKGQIITQKGKAIYCAEQFLGKKGPNDRYAPDKLDDALTFYKNHIPNRKQAYRHSRNLRKPEKVFCSVIPTEILEEITRDMGICIGRMGVSGTLDKDAGDELLKRLEIYRP